MQKIAKQLKSSYEHDNGDTPPWLKYLSEGMKILSSQTEQDFKPPSSETDKLYMSIGEKDLIEVAHPSPQGKSRKR